VQQRAEQLRGAHRRAEAQRMARRHPVGTGHRGPRPRASVAPHRAHRGARAAGRPGRRRPGVVAPRRERRRRLDRPLRLAGRVLDEGGRMAERRPPGGRARPGTGAARRQRRSRHAAPRRALRRGACQAARPAGPGAGAVRIEVAVEVGRLDQRHHRALERGERRRRRRRVTPVARERRHGLGHRVEHRAQGDEGLGQHPRVAGERRAR
jgi:hypothetical protein